MGLTTSYRWSYILLRALSQVPADLIVYDLAGARCGTCKKRRAQWAAASGLGRLDESGATAPPGLYILRLSIDTDTGSEDRSLLVGLAY